jgi:hypothetical protein
MLQMAAEKIIRGITFVNDAEHHAISNYKTRLSEVEGGVHVVEMSTMEGLDGRLMVFGRFISRLEHMQRMKEYMADPETYLKKHIQSLGENTWHS